MIVVSVRTKLFLPISLLLGFISIFSASESALGNGEAIPLGFFPFGAIVCFIVISILIITILILLWVYNDAKKRGENPVLWLIVCLVGGIIGLIIWVIVRPPIKQNQEVYVVHRSRPPPPNYRV